MKTLKFTRNGIALGIAVLAGASLVSAPVVGAVTVWAADTRWLWTAGALLAQAIALYIVATVLYDDEAEVKK